MFSSSWLLIIWLTKQMLDYTHIKQTEGLSQKL